MKLKNLPNRLVVMLFEGTDFADRGLPPSMKELSKERTALTVNKASYCLLALA